MAVLTVQSPSLSGATPTYGAVSASDQFANTGREVLHVKNGSGASINVTVVSQKDCDQGFSHNLVVAVPAGQERTIGPFPPARFSHADTGRAEVQYSATASVTAGVFRTHS